jgi:hypothetical protein
VKPREVDDLILVVLEGAFEWNRSQNGHRKIKGVRLEQLTP